MLKYVAVAAVAVALSLSGALGLVDQDAPAEPVAGVRVVGAGADLATTVEALQARLTRLPADDAAWATLGLAYVEQARVSGDASFYAKAAQAVERSFDERPDDNAAAFSSSAALAAARHDFSGALADADAALAISPYDAQALAVRVDALTELGRYGDQLAALRTADRRRPGVPVAARYAYAFELRGDLPRATAILTRAAGSASGADRAYLLTLAADLDRRQGRLVDSARHLREAVRISPDHVPALVALARLAVAEGDPGTAVARWTDVVARMPLPEYLVELGELQLHLGRPAEARRQFAVVDATVALLRSGGVGTDLEVAAFEADHGSPEEAVRAAREEWAARRSIHVADALGWALHTDGRDRRALLLLRQATRLGTAEARPWLHRGLVEAALGRDGEAVRHLRRGLAADPGVSPWQADRARTALRTLTGGDPR